MFLAGAGGERLPADRRASPWRLPPPLPAGRPCVLLDVAAASPEEVWVVGRTHGRPLAACWNGASWTMPLAPPPAAALIGAGLEGVTVVRAVSGDGDPAPGMSRFAGEEGREASPHPGGPAEVIAVGGAYDRLIGTEIPLIWQWDGAEWTQVPAPVLPDGSLSGRRGPAGEDRDTAEDYVLTDVATVGSAEVWAVGHGFPARGGGPVALRRRDGRWRPVAGLPRIAQGKLLAVGGTSPQDVWAVGAADRTGLVVHYDGGSWRRMRVPVTRFPLTDVAAVAPDDVWCAGGDAVLRWNGRRWFRVEVPVASANTVTALSATDVWVGGARGDLAHYDGHRWVCVAAPEDLHDTAVWCASTAGRPHRGGMPTAVWMVGSRRLNRPRAAPRHCRFTSWSGKG